MSDIGELKKGLETAYIDGTVVSEIALRPTFVSNDYKEGKKVLSSIEEELLRCDHFQISVAFITLSGVTPLLQTLQELEKRGITGEILTTNYLNFSEPKALETLNGLSNITIRMYDVEKSGEGFHTKGYIFKKNDIYRIIIGSSNITQGALTSNKEWNTKLVSTENGIVAQQIVEEFQLLWDSKFSRSYDAFIDEYRKKYEIIKHQKEIAKKEEVVSLEKFKLQPNSMQLSFIAGLKKIIDSGEDRALLISATGTGKTYASAFAMRELGFKKVLFLVHRNQLAKQTKRSYEKVFSYLVSMGLIYGGNTIEENKDKDFVFATVQTLSREENLKLFDPMQFSCIILDETHHSVANSYQRIMNYFQPDLWLGMTATPDKRDDHIEGRNVYELFHYNIAGEIRLQQAMQDKLLCPFHYFGITDISMIGDDVDSGSLSDQDFSLLTSDERVRHVAEQAQYYGYSGDRVKGLVFCSYVKVAKELSDKFNRMINPETGKKYRTIELDGSASEEERELAFERLAVDEDDERVINGEMEPLDYIFSRDILNEGVDIVEVNQVIMLRPTQSPIIFIQQLGRGLRKAEGKEYVVILDFIGNYNNNFMIPIALSGDRTFNKDNIRKYVISGNNVIPGASTVHFDSIAKERIFQSIDRMKGIKAIIRESYANLKNRLGRIPYLLDFYENGEVDPLLIVQEYKTYYEFLLKVEKDSYQERMSETEKITLEYLSKTIISGVRPYELEILKRLLSCDQISLSELSEEMKMSADSLFGKNSLENAVQVLEGRFVSKEEEYQKYKQISILEEHDSELIRRMSSYASRLRHDEFCRQINDIVSVGLARYREKYDGRFDSNSPFVLYEKYSRRDVSLIMNCGRDLSSTMYGMKRIDDDVFIFITYHKAEAENEDMQYAEGKPDYADSFVDSTTFRWDSQIGKGPESGYMKDVTGAERKHLLVKKSDAESRFYYMGTFDVIGVTGDKKMDNNGKNRDITKVTMRMHHSVREDILKYLESYYVEEAV
ncbi:MAG: DEAD/DEAH box helicase [Lachnospiraceae bacterium]|nr:DEAD/DEAH box helicase [Lachnospiraceae bacterium]